MNTHLSIRPTTIAVEVGVGHFAIAHSTGPDDRHNDISFYLPLLDKPGETEAEETARTVAQMTDLIDKLTAARDELAATTNQPQPTE